MTLTREQWRIRAVLNQHIGSANSITNAELARLVSIDRRKVRLLIKDMIETHGIIICSSVRQPCGYFMPESHEEVATYKRQLISRMVELNRRVTAIDRPLGSRCSR